MKKTVNNVGKPQHFIGSLVSAGLGIGNSILTAIQQKKTADEQARLAEEQRIKGLSNQYQSLLESDKFNARDFEQLGSISAYAKGGINNGIPQPSANVPGVKEIASDMSIAYGSTHNESNPFGNGTGIPYGDIEVEGGGKQGNQAGEVIKHENGNDFIFSDRLKYNNNHTFAEAAEQLTYKKSNLEKMLNIGTSEANALLDATSKIGNIVDVNTLTKYAQNKNIKLTDVKSELNKVNADIETLKQKQLAFGKQLGIYDEDGKPIDNAVPTDQMAYGGIDEDYNQSLDGITVTGKYSRPILTLPTTSVNINNNVPKATLPTTASPFVDHSNDVDNSSTFNIENAMSSPIGQLGTGLVSAGINYLSNNATQKALAKIRPTGYVNVSPVLNSNVNLTSDKRLIEDGIASADTYANENFANPQVASAIRANARANATKQYGEVTQREESINANIDSSNAQRIMGTNQFNAQMNYQNNMQQYQKSIQDIQVRAGVRGALISDVSGAIKDFNAARYKNEQLALYALTNKSGVNRDLESIYKYNVNPNDLRNKTEDEQINYLKSKGMSQEDINSLLGLSSSSSTTKFANGGNFKYGTGGDLDIDNGIDYNALFGLTSSAIVSSVPASNKPKTNDEEIKINKSKSISNNDENILEDDEDMQSTTSSNGKSSILKARSVIKDNLSNTPKLGNTSFSSTKGLNPILDQFDNLLKEEGIDLRTTSTIRNSKTSSGNISKHASGNAKDAVPTNMSFDAMYTKIFTTPRIMEYAKANNIGFINESDPRVLKRTGGTGNHIHISVNEKMAMDIHNPEYFNNGKYTDAFYKKYNIK